MTWSWTPREMQMPPGSAPLDPSRYVYPVAENVAVLHHDIADIDADSKPHPALVRELLIGARHIALNFNGALHRGKHACKCGEHAVAGRPADSAAMLCNECVGDRAKVREGRQRSFLVDSHHATIARDVCREDGH